MEKEVPPIIERITDPNDLLAQIVECLALNDSRGLKTYILEHKLKDESIMWEVVLKIGEKVTAKLVEENEEFFTVCNRCLTYLVKVGKPKEMLLAILEQMDTFIDDVKYTCFLPLIQYALLAIPTKLFHSLDIALETISAHVRSLPVPENTTLEGDERRLFHIDQTVVRIVNILQHFLDFLEPLVKSVVTDQNIIDGKKKHEALVLKKHLVRIFDFPFVHLVLTHNRDKPKTNGRECVEQAMKLLSLLETDYHRFLTNAQNKQLEKEIALKSIDSEKMEEPKKSLNNEEVQNEKNELRMKQKEKSKENDFVECWDFKLEVAEGAQACLAYIIMSEYLGIEKMPQIFTKLHLLEHNLDNLSFLLKNPVFPINEKGLLLGSSLVKSIMPQSIPSHCLDHPGYLKVINDLVHIMTKCPVSDHRTAALPLFTTFIRLFDCSGRYLIYDSFFSSCTHSGVKGYVVTLLKDDINAVIRQSNHSEKKTESYIQSVKYFTGNKLKRILLLASNLPEKETSDMLENSDQIISVFNLLRFLVLADPSNKNITGIWDFLPDLRKDFLEPMRKGLDLSEAHYNLEQQNVVEGKESVGNLDMDVSVGGGLLPKMQKEEKLVLIAKALNSHQLMKSLLSRLVEIIDRDVGQQDK